jgi:hypothetical protein
MADDRSIILSLELNSDKALSSIVSLKERIAALKAEQKNLNTETAEGKKQAAAYQAQITNLTKEQRSLENGLQATTGTFNFQAGSIAGNRAELSKLTAEYKNLANPTKEQTNKILELTNTLKGQEEAIGSANRNVGNYTKSILEAGLGNTKFGAAIQSAGQSFGGLKSGVDGASKGFAGLKQAIIATGIGAFLLLVVGLVQAFAKTEEGGEKIEQMMAGLGAVVEVLTSRMAKLANALIDFASGDFAEGVKKTKEAFSDLGTEINKTVGFAVALKKVEQDIEDIAIKQDVANAKRAAQVEELIKQSKDRTKSEKERLALLDEASKIEKDGSRADILLKEAKLLAEKGKLMNQIAKGLVTEGNLTKEYAAAEVDYVNAKSQAQQKLQVIDNRRAAFLLEEETANKKRHDDELARLAKLKAMREAELQARISEVQKLDSSEQQLINARNEREVKGIQGKIDLNKKQLADILSNEKLTASEKIEIEKSNNEASKAVIDERVNSEILANAQKYAILAEQKGLNTFDITRIEEEGKANELAIAQRGADEKIALDKRVADNEAREIERVAEIRRVSNETAAAAAANLAGVLAGLAEKGSDEFKALAITQALINTYLGVSQAIAQGGVAGFITGAAVLVGGLANVAKIAALKDGAIELQGAGTETSDSIPAMLSKGESVMTAKETRMFKPQLIQMRAAARNNRFATGVIGLQDGGFAARQAGSTFGQSIDPAMLLRVIESMPAPVVSVKDINVSQKRVSVIEAKATL